MLQPIFSPTGTILLILLTIPAALFVLGSLAAPLLLLPIMLIVRLLAKIFLKNYTSVPKNATAAIAARTGRPFNFTLNLITDGKVEIVELQKKIQEVLNRQDDQGKRIYSRMREYVKSFLGYSFFIEDMEFKIENHVNLRQTSLEIKEENSQDLKSFLERTLAELTSRNPWPVNRSPWELQIVHVNYKNDSKTLFFFACHHVLMDGFSCLNFFQQLGPNENGLLPEFENRKIVLSPMVNFIRHIKIPSDFLKTISFFRGVWPGRHISAGDTDSLTFNCSVVTNEDISVDDIRKMKNKFGVKYDTIVYSAVGACISRMMEESGQIVPKYLTVGCPLPRLNHPKITTNHFSPGIILLPINCKSAEERLRETDAYVTAAKISSSPLYADLFGSHGGILLPRFVMNIIARIFSYNNPIITTSFPSIDNCWIGKHMVSFGACVFMPPHQDCGMTVTIFGVKPFITPAFFTREDYIPPSISSKFGDYFREEIGHLKTFADATPTKFCLTDLENREKLQQIP